MGRLAGHGVGVDPCRWRMPSAAGSCKGRCARPSGAGGVLRAGRLPQGKADTAGSMPDKGGEL